MYERRDLRVSNYIKYNIIASWRKEKRKREGLLYGNNTIISFAIIIESIKIIDFLLPFFLIFQLHIALPINDELNFGAHFRYNDTGLPTGCLFTFDVIHIIFPSPKG